MADNIEHLILEQFRAMRNQVASLQSEMSSEFADVKYRINRLETAVAGMRYPAIARRNARTASY
jgi:hypothetical protein